MTKTFHKVEELERYVLYIKAGILHLQVCTLISSNVTKTFPKVEELERYVLYIKALLSYTYICTIQSRMMEDSSDDDTSHYSFVLSDDEEYNEE